MTPAPTSFPKQEVVKTEVATEDAGSPHSWHSSPVAPQPVQPFSTPSFPVDHSSPAQHHAPHGIATGAPQILINLQIREAPQSCASCGYCVSEPQQQVVRLPLQISFSPSAEQPTILPAPTPPSGASPVWTSDPSATPSSETAEDDEEEEEDEEDISFDDCSPLDWLEEPLQSVEPGEDLNSGYSTPSLGWTDHDVADLDPDTPVPSIEGTPETTGVITPAVELEEDMFFQPLIDWAKMEDAKRFEPVPELWTSAPVPVTSAPDSRYPESVVDPPARDEDFLHFMEISSKVVV